MEHITSRTRGEGARGGWDCWKLIAGNGDVVRLLTEGDTEPGDSPRLGSLRRDLEARGVGGTLSTVPARGFVAKLGRLTSVGPTLARFAGDAGPLLCIRAGEANVDIGGGCGRTTFVGLVVRAATEATAGVALLALAGLSAREGAEEADGVRTVDIRGRPAVLDVLDTFIFVVAGVTGGGWIESQTNLLRLSNGRLTGGGIGTTLT